MLARVLRPWKSLISQYVRRSRELSRVGGRLSQMENESWPALGWNFEWAFEEGLNRRLASRSRGNPSAFCGLEHAGGNFGDESAWDESLAVCAEVIPEAGNDVAFARSKGLQAGAGNFLRGLALSLEFFLARHDVEFGFGGTRAERADANPVRLHFFSKAF